MAIRGIVGAVYESDAAPISDNIALLFDWAVDVEHRKEYTYGPELHGIPTGWHVAVQAYWAEKDLQQDKAFIRLFIGKGEDKRCLAGQVELPVLKKTDGINASEIRLEGVSLLEQEDEHEE